MAAGIDAYRYERLGAAEAHARATGYQGARFPWESALDGTEQIPPPSVNTEGMYEQHITADVALAQWQYYLATGDRAWLAHSRLAGAVPGRRLLGQPGDPRPARQLPHHAVTGPDEENPDVNNEVYTNVAAATTLRDATAAARVAGASAPASWARIAHGLVVLYGAGQGINPEFSGYQGQMVKQADATMLYYPWRYATSAAAAARDLNYYVPRTDPSGPSMSDAINSIDTSALARRAARPTSTRSAAWSRSSETPSTSSPRPEPAERSPSLPVSAASCRSSSTAIPGCAGPPRSVQLGPSLTSQLGGIVLRELNWHGRVFTVSIGPATTTVRLPRPARRCRSPLQE